MENTDARSPSDAIAKEIEKFQGTWRQIAHERDGVADPADEKGWEPRVTFTGDTFVVTLADGSIALKGTFKVDPTQEPKAVDWTDTFGPDAGKTFLAIYTLEGDRLVFCAGDGQARPKVFRAGPGEDLRVNQREVPCAKALLGKWIEAFNRHDADLVASYYHDDAVNWQGADEPVAGKAQIRDMLAQFFAAFPDSYSRVENLIGDGEWAAWEWIGGGRFARDLGPIKATGNAYELRGCGFFRIVAGKIHLQRGYWDKNTWLSQIGVPPTASVK